MKKLRSVKNLLLIFPILLAVITGIFLIVNFYDKIPTDFGRTKLILSILGESGKVKKKKPDVVVFGSSVIMAGINGNILSDSLHKTVYNLSSTGQKLPESMLYYGLLEKPVSTVVQFVSVDELIEPPRLEKPKIRNIRLLGYKLDTVVERLLAPLPSDLEYLETSKSQLAVDSRAILSSSINRYFRVFLRKDLKLGELNTELYYPTPYTKRISDEKYLEMIKKYNPKELIETVQINSKTLELLKRSGWYFKGQGIRYVLVIQPTNPSLTNYSTGLKGEILKQFQLLDVKTISVLNYFDLLDDSQFIDYCHPAPDGAIVMSNKLFTDLKKITK